VRAHEVPGSVKATEEPNRLRVMDLFNIQYARDPQISPDGKRVVYVRTFADVTSDRQCSNLWIINTDGSDHRPLTTGPYSDSSPRWSPDGTRLTYISDRDGKPQVYLRWMDTGQTAQLTHLQYAPSGLAWSPDGKQISFTAMVPDKPLDIIKNFPKAPKDAKWQEMPTAYDGLIYRFNAAGYREPGYTQIFVVSADGGTPRQVTSGQFHHGGGFGLFPSEAVWTPDGKYILVSANRHDDFDFDPQNSEIYEFNVETGAVRALTSRKGPDRTPQVSPDGKHIAYTGFDDKYQGYQVVRLYLMDRDGSNPHSFSDKLDRDVRSPHWAPDGSGIYFLYDDQGNTKVGFYSLDGKFRKIAEHLGANGSAYAGGRYSVARGMVAFEYTRPDVPGDIAVVSGSGQPKVITDLNRDLLAQRKLGKVEEIWFESSHDKRKVQAWVIKPPDFDPKNKYPLILEIHGGPFANYGDRFDFEKQIMAAQNYVVLYVNPRGSTSYGEEFGNLIDHAYPGDDFFDLNSGVDALLAKGYVDPQNLFVTGGSGGGVLTCWMVGRTTRFRAAAALYPVINWYSFALTADIPMIVVKYWFQGMPWDYADDYMKRSVISLVKNVKTPTMVMTGESDYRTPISEAEQYYVALKLMKVDALLVRVPDEPHGISRHPSHHIGKMLYILGWFDKYKKNEGPPVMKAETKPPA
jgi:acylaminoacyl-peptidase